MAIRFFYKNRDFELISEVSVTEWVKTVIKSRGKRVGSINYLFTDDEEVLDKNRRFLNHDTYTDIITFDNVVGDTISGDIIISVDRVKENANMMTLVFEQELKRVIIHGVLHLLGQGDKSSEEAAEMRRQEEEALLMFREKQSL